MNRLHLVFNGLFSLPIDLKYKIICFAQLRQRSYRYLIQIMESKSSKPDRLPTLKQVIECNPYQRPGSKYNTFNIIPPNDADLLKYTQKLDDLFKESPKVDYNTYFQFKSPKESRGIACLLGLGITDALGASTQFIAFQKYRHHLITKGFQEIPLKIRRGLMNRRGEVGVWTDDCSMALCLADSILATNFNFNPIDLRYRFTLWLDYGLNNGGRPYSIGLGGNISISMEEFNKHQKEYCNEGDKFNNGNGSLMRLAPSAIGYHDNLELGMEVSAKQSRTTHNGDEAMECSRLLARIIIMLINRQEHQVPKAVLVEACNSYKTNVKQVKTVECLARSMVQPEQLFTEQSTNPKFNRFNKSRSKDRNWNWQHKDWTYSKTRLKQQPEYIGSYCMDGLCMALHIAYHTNSFVQAALWAVNMGGDCDTVGAIVGQITGAMYGMDSEMMRLYSEMPDTKQHRYHLFLKGYKLVNKKRVEGPSPFQEPKPTATEQCLKDDST